MSELKIQLDQAGKRMAAAQRSLERCQEQFDAAAMSLKRAQALAAPKIEGPPGLNDND